MQQRLDDLAIIRLDSIIFSLAMKDKWDNRDRELDTQYRKELAQLRKAYIDIYHANPLIDKCATRIDVMALHKQLEV